MKLKQLPADFIVEELADTRTLPHGAFAFYRLRKVGWTTHDALHALCRSWNIAWQQVSYGGLKDRHAETVQYFTIERGPALDWSQPRLDVTYLGQWQGAYHSRWVQGNRFKIVVRELTDIELSAMLKAMNDMAQIGLPNYYDDQRFGSVAADGRFIGKELVLGHFEEVLKLALAGPYQYDTADAKEEKAILLRHWNDWPACKAALPKGHARSIVTYLCDHPTKFKGAFARLRPELQGLFFSAYQSELWNRTLARWLRAQLPPEQLSTLPLQRGALPSPLVKPADNWLSVVVPLPNPKLNAEQYPAFWPHLESVLAEEEITLKQLKVPGLDTPYFTKGDRPACLMPQNLQHTVEADELNPPHQKLTLSFDLPRGSYATMVVKRLTAP